MLMVHGFGANADHWRKNTPGVVLSLPCATTRRCLLGAHADVGPLVERVLHARGRTRVPCSRR